MKLYVRYFPCTDLPLTNMYRKAMTRTVELYPHAFDILHTLYVGDAQVHLIFATMEKFGK